MVVGSLSSRFFAGLVLSGFMLTVTGCQSGDGGGFFSSRDKQVPAPADGQVLASQLTGYCPNVTLREGTAYFNTYAKGGQDDPAKIVYQAAITDVTRDCNRNNGMLTMNVAVAGKVVPGPLGAAGTITMPIRVVVVQGTSVLYSQIHPYKVQIGNVSAATQFVFNDPNVTVPQPSSKNYQVFVGYDEGPPRKKVASTN